MRISLLCLCFLMVACGDKPENPRPGYVAPELRVYVEGLQDLSLKVEGRRIPLASVSIEVKEISTPGECVLATGQIYIDAGFWALLKSDHEAMEATLMHEIGHCVFHRGHEGGAYDSGSGAPPTIMHDGAEWVYNYRNNKEIYMKDLWKGSYL